MFHDLSSVSPFQYNEDYDSVSPLDTKSTLPSSDYREVPLARSLRHMGTGFSRRSSIRPIQPPTLKDEPTTPERLSPPSSRPHIPRPPNAFMIYRSELIKNRAVPLNIEHRQQNLSRLAGECWNLLPQEEKDKYHKKAAEVLKEHQRLNPDYKFSPSPRGSRRAKAKAIQQPIDTSRPNNSERIRAIREQYVKVLGPSLVASRRRKRKTRGSSTEDDKPHESLLQLGHPSDLLTRSGRSSPVSSTSPRSMPDNYHRHVQSSPFPQATLPRRPSTSLGFATNPIGAMPNRANYTFDTTSDPFSGFIGFQFQNFDISPTDATTLDTTTPLNFNYHLPDAFNFDNMTLPTIPPPDFNNLLAQDYEGISPFAQPLPMIFHPQPPAQNVDPCMYQPSEFSMGAPTQPPIDPTSQLTPLPAAFDDWKVVHNPSEEFNYALRHIVLPQCLPRAESSG